MSPKVRGVGTSSELQELLRQVPVKGHPALRPYRNARIAVERLQVDSLVPLAKYVLQTQLDYLTTLQRDLHCAGFNLFELEGILSFQHARSSRRIAPPVVEVSQDGSNLLVDGLHRAWIAERAGEVVLSCAVIREVSTPLVPLPVEWKDICVYAPGHNPREEDKRDFRFTSADAVRQVVGEFSGSVTEENFRYFLYRDLEVLGSAGIRAIDDPIELANEEDAIES